MKDNKGEARLWGDAETVYEIARFFEKYQKQLLVVVEVRKLTGQNTATGLYEDMKKCWVELEIERMKNKKEILKEEIEEKERKKRELLKSYS